jgi:hypothetical protein
MEAITQTLEAGPSHIDASFTLAYALGVLRRPQPPLGTPQSPLQVMDSCAPPSQNISIHRGDSAWRRSALSFSSIHQA